MRWSQVILLQILFVTVAFGKGFEMASIPNGKLIPFWLTPVTNKKAPKKISISSFEMMKYAVTVSQYEQFLLESPNWKPQSVSSLFADASYLESWQLQLRNKQSPVTYVSWFAARAFCEFYGMRLPTVNEWEYAAAASETKKDANKNEAFLKRILDWYGEPRGESLKSVGSIYKNVYGVWDLHGLIWEWVDDFNTLFVTGESREDSSFNKNMFCGAGAMSGADKENYAAFMRFAFRSSLKGRSSAWNLGFRCVR